MAQRSAANQRAKSVRKADDPAPDADAVQNGGLSASMHESLARLLETQPADPRDSAAEELAPQGRNVNVGDVERSFCVGAGALLALYGIKKLPPLWLAAAGAGAYLLRRGVTGHCEVYNHLGRRTPEDGAALADSFAEPMVLESRLEIHQSAAKVYHALRDLDRASSFLAGVEVREVLSPTSVRLAVPVAVLGKLEWTADVDEEDEESYFFGWKAVAGAEVFTEGTVLVVPATKKRCEVHVTVLYEPPAGRLGASVGRLIGLDPQQVLQHSLENLRELLESNHGTDAAEGKEDDSEPSE